MSPRILGVEVCAHSEGFGGRENAADVPDSGQEAVFVPWILRRLCQFTSSKLFVREIYLKNICFNCSYCEAKRSNNWKLKSEILQIFSFRFCRFETMAVASSNLQTGSIPAWGYT